MKKSHCLLVCCCLLLLASGCAPLRKRGAANGEMAGPEITAAPGVPAGMRLGNRYYSALGETCYEVLPDSGPASQARATCFRQGGWVLQPHIHSSISQSAATSAR